MVFVEIIYVLSADDIDLGVPLSVQSVKLCYLLFLSVREVRKVFVDDIHVVFCYCGGKVTKKDKKQVVSMKKDSSRGLYK